MRPNTHRHTILALALAGALLSVPSAATGLRWGRSGIAQTLPDLGPVGNGRRSFLEFNCYGCHGMNGAGGEGPFIQHASQSLVEGRVQNGGSAGMPSFKKYLSRKNADDIAAYLATIGTKDEPMWVDWWVAQP